MESSDLLGLSLSKIMKLGFYCIYSNIRYALEVSKHGSVAIITKAEPYESNTQYAQGGVSAVLCPTDSVESHMQDTIVAGAYLCDEETVRVCNQLNFLFFFIKRRGLLFFELCKGFWSNDKQEGPYITDPYLFDIVFYQLVLWALFACFCLVKALYIFTF